MTRDGVIRDLKDRFSEAILDFLDRSPKRLYVEINPQALVPVATHIFRDLEARFHTASGVDTRTHLEILYHFSIETMNLLISLRVKLDRKNPKVASLAGVIKGANWIEREMSELLGIEFTGHPDRRRLLLAEEWPKGVYPLRADYQEWDKKAIRDRGV